ncbi:MAG: lasso peptide biosynthesis B2 protein [Myxococcales bacterium]|nr:lasso peptide biosynthesis B2 protein [Myxococcales bacterium]
MSGSALGKVRTLALMSQRDRGTILAMAPAALVVRFALGRAPLTAVARALGVHVARSPRGTPPEISVERAEEAVRAAALFGRNSAALSTCLPQSLLIAHALRRHGATVVLGVALHGDSFGAHAWVEVGPARLEPRARGGAPEPFVPLRRSA